MTRYQFLPIMQRKLAQIINPDVEWCGGISEAKKTASLAETFHLPVAFHNYGGPILNVASAHVAAAINNLMLLETGRYLIAQWTEDIITQPIRISDSYMMLPEGPGLGVSLSPSLLGRENLDINVVQ
jgi:galactonate dehydratase